MLFDTLLGVKDGSVSREDAQAIVNTSKAMVATLDVELRAQRAAFEMGLQTEDAKIIAPPMLQLCDDRTADA